MDPVTMAAIVLLIIVSASLYIFIQEKRSQAETLKRSATLKKEQIIADYQEQMRSVLQTNHDDEKVCLHEKTRLLKRINRELSTNIFFYTSEVRPLLKMLADQTLKS